MMMVMVMQISKKVMTVVMFKTVIMKMIMVMLMKEM
jgi:hypothetical protein